MSARITPLRVAVVVIALSQLVLGIAFLFFPNVMYTSMGIPPATVGMTYILGLLSARLLAYGVVLLRILPTLERHTLWLDTMIAIQIIDFVVGVACVAQGWVPMASAALPMGNAAAFALALLLFRPKTSSMRGEDSHA